jgi:cystathionine gamma-synthase
MIMPPYFNSTFERAVDGTYPHGNVYGRGSNPTRELFEKTMADLEKGANAAAFSSGSAAFYTVFSALEAGQHVLLPDDVYHGTRILLDEVMTKHGISYTQVDMTNLYSVSNAIQQNTALIVLETPSNPLLKITDLKKLIALSKERNIYTLVDNTWSTPLITRPLEMGADLVLQSVTKYIGGHSDLLGGVVVSASEHDLWKSVKHIQGVGGAIMDPMTAWLSLRGLRSMGVRLQRQCENALQISKHLENHPRVSKVHYPGLKTNEGYEIAQNQMYWPGAMLSIQIKNAKTDECIQSVAKAKLFKRATSLGGTESLIEHRASVEAQPTKTPENLLRVSVGLESIDSLIDDLNNILLAKA